MQHNLQNHFTHTGEEYKNRGSACPHDMDTSSESKCCFFIGNETLYSNDLAQRLCEQTTLQTPEKGLQRCLGINAKNLPFP